MIGISLILCTCFKLFGLKSTLKKVRHILSFYWLVLLILEIRDGKSYSEKLSKAASKVIENDEDFVRKAIKSDD